MRKIKTIKNIKSVRFLIIGIIIGAGIMYILPLEKQSADNSLLTDPIQYNCELSGGVFESGACVCPIEEELGQTQEMMYDESSGFCQTTHGGSGGDAFRAENGLPWGSWQYYNDIINYWCNESGGSKSTPMCNCPAEKTYNKSNGRCE